MDAEVGFVTVLWRLSFNIKEEEMFQLKCLSIEECAPFTQQSQQLNTQKYMLV